MILEQRVWNKFIGHFNVFSKEVFINNISHGFHDDRDNALSVPTKLALIHSEVSEALEAHRNGQDEHLAEEIADVVIRCMDLAEAEGLDLGKAIVDKHQVNLGRPFKHGNKRY